ncbi:hypothetical protein SAMN05720470_11224 [Fibrobacter sp. UWOV1]|nr:hypothetical protein SAMN05720470_11224 [Fibrobacter sp. UWOV1]
MYLIGMNSRELQIVKQIVLLVAVAVTLGFIYG